MKNNIETYNDWQQKTIIVRNGSSNGRSVHQPVINGRITISGISEKNGKPFKRVLKMEDGQILDNLLTVEGKTVHHIVYGQFESKLTYAGREITRFRGTGRGKHGKAVSYPELFGKPGVCHSWYKQGRLIRQRYFYKNGVIAYDYSNKRRTVIKRDNGEVLFEVQGQVRNPGDWQGIKTVFYGPLKAGTLAFEFGDFDVTQWFNQSEPFKVSRNGKVIHSGQWKNQQRTGIWYINGVEHCYEHGVAIPKKLYETPAHKLNPVKLLKIPNAQLRMAMLEKVGPARLAECGKLIHKQGSMRLWDIPGMENRILRVQCPSTKSLYHIKVPKDSVNCEEARQWTFHLNGPGGVFLQPGRRQIVFSQET